MSRSTLHTSVTDNILSGGRRTTAVKTRETLDMMIDSLVIKDDDLNVAGGYLGISGSGLVDVSFIKSATPSGLFLRDDGTWAAASGGGASGLPANLLIDNTTGGSNLVLSGGDYLSSLDNKTQIDLGDGNYIQAYYYNAGHLSYLDIEEDAVVLYASDGAYVSKTAQLSLSTVLAKIQYDDLSGTSGYLRIDGINVTLSHSLGALAFDGQSYSITNFTASTLMFVDSSNNIVPSYLSQDAYGILIDSTKSIKSSDSASSLYLSDAAGPGTGLSYTHTSGAQGQVGFDQYNSLFTWTDGGALNTVIQLSAAKAYVQHPTQITFDSPIYNFATATTELIPFIDASGNMVASYLYQDAQGILLTSGKTIRGTGSLPDATIDFSNGGNIYLNAPTSTVSKGEIGISAAKQITFTSPLYNFASANASRVAIFDSSKNLVGADTSTYPTLTEFSYVKGVTSSIQAQLDAIVAGAGTVTSVSGVAANGFTWSIATSTTTPAITLTLQNATTSQSGQLTSTDWNTFNAKQAALSGTGFVKISGTTISYDNSTYLTTTTGDARYLQLSGGTLTGALILNADPSTALGAATKQYVDNLIAGLKFKVNVRAASTGSNVNISSAPATLDGVTLVSGVDRIVLKDQTAGTENGSYLFNGTGNALTRTTDGDTGSELVSATFPVSEGTVNQDTWWTITNDSITIGVTNIVFTQTAGSGTYAAGSGITLTGNTFSIAAGAITNTMLAGSIAYSKLSLTGSVLNADLVNSSTTINGTTISLGASGTVTAAAGTLTGTTLNATVVTSSLTSVGTITTGVWNGTSISDSKLAGVYIYADGSRALSADWNAGAFNITSKTQSISGTGGNGYMELIAQSSNAAAAASAGFRLFAGSTGSFNWVRKNGSDTYVRTFDATLTADHTYTLQDATSTIAMYSNKLSVFSATTSAELAGVISDETGSGSLVFATSPTLVTPALGVASATSISITGTGGNGYVELLTQSSDAAAGATNSVRLFSSAGWFAFVNKNDTYVRKFDGTLTANHTYTLQDVTSTIAMYSNNLSVFAATTSAQLLAVISDETGSGSLVFATSPTLVTPTLGAATATTINNITFTTPATAATLTLANNTTTSVTGGGTVALGGFTLTVPATGTATLGSPGASGRVFVGTAATAGAGSTTLTYTSSLLDVTTSANANIGYTVTNNQAGSAATAILQLQGNTGLVTNVQQFGGSFTTSGLLIGHLSRISTTSSVGMLFQNNSASTKYWWTIGGSGTANEVMRLTSTGLSVMTLADNTQALDVKGSILLTTAGNGILIKEGTNATMGTVALVAGTATVSTTKVTANSRIFLCSQSLGTVSVGQGLAVSARTAATSFTITSGSAIDTSTVAWLIVEPG